MNGASTTTSLTGSDGIISGMPAAISLAENVYQHYESLINQAINEIAAEEQTATRERAAKTEGWEKFADSIRVAYDPEMRELKYTAEGDEDEIRALEFGDRVAPPNPLLRTQAARSRETFLTRVTERTHELLGGTY